MIYHTQSLKCDYLD